MAETPPAIAIPKPRPQSARNRRNGKDAQRVIARRLGAIDIGILGGVDLDGGYWWGEVKRTTGLPGWLKKGMEQLSIKGKSRPCFLFVLNARGHGLKPEMYVVETLEQWEEMHGLGAFTEETATSGLVAS